MKRQIQEVTITRSWYTKLVLIVDKLNEAIDIDDVSVDTHDWLSHLTGYVHSLDEHFNKEK